MARQHQQDARQFFHFVLSFVLFAHCTTSCMLCAALAGWHTVACVVACSRMPLLIAAGAMALAL
jgi:hypothetical protein